MTVLLLAVSCSSSGVAGQGNSSSPSLAAKRVSPPPELTGRDCSYLSGREMQDCECRKSLAGAEVAWSEGDAAKAALLLAVGMCSPSSPGLSKLQRKFVKVADEAGKRVARARAFAAEGKHREAAELWGRVNRDAKKDGFDEAWLSICYCNALGALVFREADSSAQANAALAAYAPAVLSVCEEAHAKMTASSGSAAQVGSSDREAAAGMLLVGMELEASGGAVGVQVQMLSLLGRHQEAVDVAAKHGFRMFIPRRPAGGEGGASAGGGEGVRGRSNTTSGRADGNSTEAKRQAPNLWRGLAKVIDEARCMPIES